MAKVDAEATQTTTEELVSTEVLILLLAQGN